MGTRFSVLIVRRRESYDYQRDKTRIADWGTNDKNNGLDSFLLYVDGMPRFEANCQTVANHPNSRFNDTVAPGRFGIKLFVEPRLFSGKIHGIVGARDLEGDWIDFDSVQPTDLSRWLVHDNRELKKAPGDPDTTKTTRVFWSAGCIVMAWESLAELNSIYTILKAPSVVPAELVVI